MRCLEFAKAEWWYATGNGVAPATKRERTQHELRMWELLFLAAEAGEFDWYCPLCLGTVLPTDDL